MVYYVSHCYGSNAENLEKAKKITHDLQIKDPENCYICPLLTFSHLQYNELGYEQEMALCIDLLSICDTLIVASELSEGVIREIEFAKLVGMGVVYLDEL